MKTIQSLASFAMVLFFFLGTLALAFAQVWYFIPFTMLCLSVSLNLFVQIHSK